MTWLRTHGPTVAVEVVVNLLGPALIFDLVHGRYGDVAGLLASSVPPLVWSIGGLVRRRQLDALSILVLAGIALSVVLIETLSVAEYLLVGPIIGYVTIGGLTLWTVFYRRRTRRGMVATPD